MEAKNCDPKSYLTDVFIAFLPFTIFLINSFLLRYTGFGLTAYFADFLIKIPWIIMGLFFPLLTCPKSGNAFLRYFGFFSACLIIAISPLALPALGEASASFFFMAGVYYGATSIFGLASPVAVTLAAKYILNLQLTLVSILRVALFCLIYDLIVSADSPARFFPDGRYGQGYIYVSLVGTLICSENYFHGKKSRTKLILASALFVAGAVLLLNGFDYLANKLSLKSGQRFDSTVSTKIDLGVLNQLMLSENREKLLAHLNSSPYWSVQGYKPLRAVLREKHGEIYLVKKSFLNQGPSLEVTLNVKESNPTFPIPDFDGDKFQEVSAEESTVDAIVFDSKYGKWDNKKEINLRVNAGLATLTFKETANEKFGDLLGSKINELRNSFIEILNLNPEEIFKKNAFKGKNAGNCFYYKEHQGSSLQVWGYVNGLEPGTVGVAVNGVLQGYQQEVIGWSSDPNEGFYFEDVVFLRDQEKNVNDVEVRFFSDAKNREYSRNNYVSLKKCEFNEP